MAYDDQELNWTETYMIAIGHGMTDGGSRDVVIAGSWSSKYNELGYYAIRFLESLDRVRRTHDPRRRADLMALVITLLATQGMYIADAREVADIAVNWLENRWCRFCNGTGVLNAEQQQCPVCLGNKEIVKPNGTDNIISEINAAIDYFERQMRARMRNWAAEPRHASYKRPSHKVDTYGIVTLPVYTE